MSIDLDYRLATLNTADVYAILDYDHCELCEAWATGLQAWWSDPNTVQGKDQLNAISEHLQDDDDYMQRARELWT